MMMMMMVIILMMMMTMMMMIKTLVKDGNCDHNMMVLEMKRNCHEVPLRISRFPVLWN